MTPVAVTELFTLRYPVLPEFYITGVIRLGFANVVAATNILTINTFRYLMSEWFLNLKIIVKLNFAGHRK